MLKFQTLTNVRPVKEQGTHLVVSTSKGNMKLTPKAAAIVDVQDGGYCGVVASGDQVFIFKGSEDLGGKLASSKKDGKGDLKFSSAVAWETLGGNSENNRFFVVEETPLPQEDLAGSPFEGKSLYPVTHEKDVPKQKRKAKKTSEEAATQQDAAVTSDAVTSDADVSVETSATPEALPETPIDNNDFADL